MSSESLLELARSRAPADRERLLLGIVELCDAGDSGPAMGSPQIQALLNSIFLGLVASAEREIRKRLADKLSTVAWAPPALINVLALDEIEIARPVIAGSPLLKDPDLIRLLIEATIEHQIEVARRPNLGASVVAAILQAARPAVMTALAGNPSAELAPADMRRLVEAQSGHEAHRAVPAGHPPAALGHDDERQAMEQRLIEKLHTAGQLRPGYLVRALQEGRLSLFVVALATLGRFDTDHVQRVIDSEQPELLGLACAAVGIDRSVFPSILEMIRRLNRGHPGGGLDGARRAVGAFGPVTPQVAATAFRQAALSV